MNIPKLIKGYFYVLLLTFSVASLSYNDDVMQYYSSTLHSFTGWTETVVATSMNSRLAYLFPEIKPNHFENSYENLVDIRFSNDSDAAFAHPGSQDVNIMTIQFDNHESVMDLLSLRLKLVGTNPNNIGNVALVNGDVVLAYAERDEEYFDFSGLEYKISPNEIGELALVLDLGAAIGTGERFHFDIEDSSDVLIKMSGRDYIVSGFYPKTGKHLSIVRAKVLSDED